MPNIFRRIVVKYKLLNSLENNASLKFFDIKARIFVFVIHSATFSKLLFHFSLACKLKFPRQTQLSFSYYSAIIRITIEQMNLRIRICIFKHREDLQPIL